MKYFRKDWILFQEIANEGGKLPEELLEVKAREENPDKNKHVPFIEETEDGYKVRIGKNEKHPNNVEHHVMFVDLYVDGLQMRKTFNINEELIFVVKTNKGKKVEAVAFCNLHGLFLGKLNS